jgi:hypothetical protein
MIYSGYVVMKRKKYICIRSVLYMYECSIKLLYDEIIIVIIITSFLFFTSKLKTQKQNTKIETNYKIWPFI